MGFEIIDEDFLFFCVESRKKWKPGSYMEVYSNSRKQWFLAECTNIFEDNEGEWVKKKELF